MKTTASSKSGKFRFCKGDHIGAASAEDDAKFLSECFVDTGDFEILSDGSDMRVIVLGRAGTGKSALLQKLHKVKGDRAIYISPESLALSYVSNSTILNYFTDLRVNLDPFFKLLWRHVFTVEILARHFSLASETKQGLFDRLVAKFTSQSREDKAMRDAIDYMSKWGKSFWQATEYRITEITQTLESRLDNEAKAAVGISGASLAAGQKTSQALSESQKAELRSRGQSVVAEAQVQDLHHVMELLDRALDDPKDQYFLLIDGLDENWVEEQLRYKFIMALIRTAREFIKVRSAKVVIVLRRDLVDRVFRLNRDAGFQEEKYLSLYLPLLWSPQCLIEVLDKRISSLVSHRYTTQSVCHKDFLPKDYDRIDISEYITSIATTPRDIIALFNECISVATGQSKITASDMRTAVGQYSRGRLRALADEWSADYPSLLDFTKLLEQRPNSFKLSAILDSEVEELCLSICAACPGGGCVLRDNAMRVVDRLMGAAEFKVFMVQVFYVIGLVGLKLAPHATARWAGETGRSVSSAEITPQIGVTVHRKYHRALGIQ
jgi:hypothetical protein